MAEQEYYLRKLLENRERFADFVNVNVYGGKRILHEEDLTLMPNESGIVMIDSEGTRQVIQRRRDVIMKARMGPYFGIIASENQGKVHRAMPVREMMYDALDYTEQVVEIEEALSLYEMMGIDGDWEGTAMLKEYLPNYRVNLIDIRDEKAIAGYETSLQYVFGMVKYNKNKKKLYDYARTHREEINHMDHDSKAAVFALLGEQKRLLKVLEDETRKEEMDMCQAIDELIEDGEIRGEVRGKRIGEINLIYKKYSRHIPAGQAAESLELDEVYVEKVMNLFAVHPECSIGEIADLFAEFNTPR